MAKMTKVVKGIYTNGNGYIVRVRKDGKSYSQTFHFHDNEDSKRKAMREAIVFQQREHTSIERFGVKSDEDKSVITLKECVETYRDNGIAHLRGVRQDRSRIKRVLEIIEEERMSDETLSRLTIDDFKKIRKNMIEQGLENSTINRMMNVFRASYNYLRNEKNIQDLYFFKELQLKVDDRKMIVTDYETVKRVIALIESERSRAGIELLFLTGARRSEVAFAKWCDVDFENRLINIERSKNDDPRSLFLNTRAIEILNSLKTEKNTAGYIFTDSEDGSKPWYQGVFSCAWGRGRKRLYEQTQDERILSISLHTLRHSFISSMVEVIDNTMTQKVLSGHRSVQMLERYYHPNNKKIMKKIGHLLEVKE